MGTDFIRNKRQQHTKAWSHQYQQRAGDMFGGAERTSVFVFRASMDRSAVLPPGTEVLIRRLDDGAVAISQDICQVGHVAIPSSDLLHFLEVNDGVLAGRVYESFADVGIVDIQIEE